MLGIFTARFCALAFLCFGGLVVAAASGPIPLHAATSSSGRLAFSHVAAPGRGLDRRITRDPGSCGVLAGGALGSRVGPCSAKSILAHGPTHRPLRCPISPCCCCSQPPLVFASIAAASTYQSRITAAAARGAHTCARGSRNDVSVSVHRIAWPCFCSSMTCVRILDHPSFLIHVY